MCRLILNYLSWRETTTTASGCYYRREEVFLRFSIHRHNQERHWSGIFYQSKLHLSLRILQNILWIISSPFLLPTADTPKWFTSGSYALSPAIPWLATYLDPLSSFMLWDWCRWTNRCGQIRCIGFESPRHGSRRSCPRQWQLQVSYSTWVDENCVVCWLHITVCLQ